MEGLSFRVTAGAAGDDVRNDREVEEGVCRPEKGLSEGGSTVKIEHHARREAKRNTHQPVAIVERDADINPICGGRVNGAVRLRVQDLIHGESSRESKSRDDVEKGGKEESSAVRKEAEEGGEAGGDGRGQDDDAGAVRVEIEGWRNARGSSVESSPASKTCPEATHNR